MALQPKYEGSLNVTLQGAVQGIVDSVRFSEDDNYLKIVYSLLKVGNGQKTVNAFFDKKENRRKMPHLNRESTFWSYIQTFLNDLQCCPNLMSDKKLETSCDKCSDSSSKASNKPIVESEKPKTVDTNSVHKFETTPNSMGSVANVPTKRKSSFTETELKSTPGPMTPTATTHHLPKTPKIQKTMASTPLPTYPLPQVFIPQTKRSSPVSVASNRAPNPTPLPPLSLNPAEWSIDDVIRHLISVDASLEAHAETFRKHVSLEFCLPFH